MTGETNYDFIVAGSGAAGLCGALSAACRGARVLVLEASSHVGGTTCFSGAGLWAPLSRFVQQAGVHDSEEDLRAYLGATLGERGQGPMWDCFIREVPGVLDFLDAELPITFVPNTGPDSFSNAPGGKVSGRHCNPTTFDMRRLGPWKDRIRKPTAPHFMTLNDFDDDPGMMLRPFPSILKKLPRFLARIVAGRRGMGSGFIGALLHACLGRGVDVRVSAPVEELVRSEDGCITGVKTGGKTLNAARGVLLACGGFEWDETLVARYLPGPVRHPMSPPLATGSNVRLAEQAGAALDAMDEAWFLSAYHVPDFRYEGTEVGKIIYGDRSLPHTIWVNRAGRRFTNEAGHNHAEAFYHRDAKGGLTNLPAWSIYDNQYRRKYPVMITVRPGKPLPDWVPVADTLEELARKIGVDAAGLSETVARYNRFAAAGVDEDFHRGEDAYDRLQGDMRAPHPCLGTLAEPPFFAIEVQPSAVGTKGGPRIDAAARVLSPNGAPVPGLYAAGNAAAAFHGPQIVALGASIMPGLLMGHLAARDAIPAPNARR